MAATLVLVPTREEVFEALRVVEDPELGMDIVELGLLYDVAVDGSKVHVTYSLTSMGCPVGPMIEQQITETDVLQSFLHDDLAAFIYDRLRRRPMVLPVVVEV